MKVYKVYKNVKLSNEGYKVWNLLESTVEITDPIFCKPTFCSQLYNDIFKDYYFFFKFVFLKIWEKIVILLSNVIKS